MIYFIIPTDSLLASFISLFEHLYKSYVNSRFCSQTQVHIQEIVSDMSSHQSSLDKRVVKIEEKLVTLQVSFSINISV